MYRHVLNNASIVTPSFTAPSKNSNYCYSHIIEQAKRIDYDDFVIIRPRRIPISQSARTAGIYEVSLSALWSKVYLQQHFYFWH